MFLAARRAMTRPNGALEPGIETGRRKGTVRIMQSMGDPLVPNFWSISPRFKPSGGRSRAKSCSDSEKLFSDGRDFLMIQINLARFLKGRPNYIVPQSEMQDQI